MPVQSNHPNSKTITIFRLGSLLSKAQGPGVDELFAESKQGVGSYYDSISSLKIGNGLTMEEEKLFLPEILDLPPDDREFRKKVTEFYCDLYTDIPYQKGRTLEIGLAEDNEKPPSKHNWPLELMDYLRYRHAMRNPEVGESKEKADGDLTKKYYIFDKTNVQSKNSKKIKQQDAAMQIYLQINAKAAVVDGKSTNPEGMATVDQMLMLLGTNPRTFAGKQKDALKLEALRDLAESRAEKFKEEYDAGDLDIRYSIEAMVSTGVIKKIGARYFDAESEDPVGNTLEEAIYFFKDDDNSGTVVTLQARLQEALTHAPMEAKKRTTVK